MDDQLISLNALKAASSQAADALKVSCSNEASMTPLDRFDTVQKRLFYGLFRSRGMLLMLLDNFYNSLNDEQRQRPLSPGSGLKSTFATAVNFI